MVSCSAGTLLPPLTFESVMKEVAVETRWVMGEVSQSGWQQQDQQ